MGLPWFRVDSKGIPEHPSPIRSAGKNYTPTVYVVGWRGAGIVKAGWTSGRTRHRSFIARGAELLAISFSDFGVDQEQAVDDLLAANYPRAFAAKADAVNYLGSSGAGWLECYAVGADEWPNLLNLIGTDL